MAGPFDFALTGDALADFFRSTPERAEQSRKDWLFGRSDPITPEVRSGRDENRLALRKALLDTNRPPDWVDSANAWGSEGMGQLYRIPGIGPKIRDFLEYNDPMNQVGEGNLDERVAALRDANSLRTKQLERTHPAVAASGRFAGNVATALGAVPVVASLGSLASGASAIAANPLTRAAAFTTVPAAVSALGSYATLAREAQKAEAQAPEAIGGDSYNDLLQRAGLPPAQARALSEQIERFHGEAAAAKGGDASQIKAGDSDNPGGDVSSQEFTGTEGVTRRGGGVSSEEIARLLAEHGLTDKGLTKNVITLRGDTASLSDNRTKGASISNAPIAPYRPADLTEREKMERLEAVEEKKRGISDLQKEQYYAATGEDQMHKALASDADKFAQYVEEAHPEIGDIYKKMIAAVPREQQDTAKQNFLRRFIPAMARDRAAARMGKDARGVKDLIASLPTTSPQNALSSVRNPSADEPGLLEKYGEPIGTIGGILAMLKYAH